MGWKLEVDIEFGWYAWLYYRVATGSPAPFFYISAFNFIIIAPVWIKWSENGEEQSVPKNKSPSNLLSG